MYIQTSMHDRKEFSKILTRELSKNFTNAVKSSERFYVNSTGENVRNYYYFSYSYV